MLTTGLVTIIIALMQIVMTTIGGLLPSTNLENIYEIIDKLIEMVQIGLAGFRFIAGPVPFVLAEVILALYGLYYFTIIPFKILLRIFIKGT